MKRRPLLTILSIWVLCTSLATGSRAAWMSGKAWLAQQLLTQTWQSSQTQGTASKPWPWADISTVARLSFPSHGRSMIVLNNASGEAMAFGPGLAGGDPLQADSSTIAIGGHRDTHLALLEHLAPASVIELENISGVTQRYELTDIQIMDTRTQSLQIATHTPGLVLITCYPFNALQTGGPLRLVARAKLISENLGPTETR